MYNTTFPPPPPGDYQQDQGGQPQYQQQQQHQQQHQQYDPNRGHGTQQSYQQPQDQSGGGGQYGGHAPQQNYQQQQYQQNNHGSQQGQNNWQNKNNSQGNWNGNRQGGFQKKQWNKRPDDGDLTLYMPYAVTGNQDCPPEIISKFIEIAKRLETAGYTARCGGMDGIEDAVEKAVKKVEVHLPWRGFNEKESRFTYNSERALAVAKMFHPTFDTMKKSIQAFLAKNARIIMGDRMNSPALFLLCWSEDGVETFSKKTSRTGYAGHPIAIASALGIPVFNLGNPEAEQRLNFYLSRS